MFCSDSKERQFVVFNVDRASLLGFFLRNPSSSPVRVAAKVGYVGGPVYKAVFRLERKSMRRDVKARVKRAATHAIQTLPSDLRGGTCAT